LLDLDYLDKKSAQLYANNFELYRKVFDNEKVFDMVGHRTKSGGFNRDNVYFC